MRIKGLVVARQASLMRATDDPIEDGTLGTMFVRFSPFDTWYEINSFFEGRFLERTVRGAFKNTINGAKRPDGRFSTKVMFNHGMDMNIGDKLLGVPTRFAEIDVPDYRGPELEVPLWDTSYNRDLLPGLRDGGYGSSFMFESIREDWNHDPGASDHNPEGLPERTISEARTFEGGPVTWPASPTATSGMRAMTDLYMEQLATRDSRRYDDLVQCTKAFRAARRTPDQRQFTPTPASDEVRRQVDSERAARERQLREIRLRQVRKSRGEQA